MILMSDQNIQQATPMMHQYLLIKSEYSDCLLFYRMGDFYELFFEDAILASKALDITLTKRGQHQGQNIAMCGVPIHAAETYLNQLIQKGFKVAVCEQTEDPAEARKRGPKAVVNRQVKRIVTPGTLSESALLNPNSSNYLAALSMSNKNFGLAWVDISTGEFMTQSMEQNFITEALSRIDPSELLIPKNIENNTHITTILKPWHKKLTVQTNSQFDHTNAVKLLTSHFNLKTLDSLGSFTPSETAAAGALLNYIKLTQIDQQPRLNPPQQLSQHDIMEIDPATRKSLELVRTLNNTQKGSLLDAIDYTLTSGGARLLANRLIFPLCNIKKIEDRLDHIAFFVAHPRIHSDLQSQLKHIADPARALARLCLGRGGPRDLAAISAAFDSSAQIRLILQQVPDATLPKEASQAYKALGVLQSLSHDLKSALGDTLPHLAKDGAFIRSGYAPDLDHLRNLAKDGLKMIAGLEQAYRKKTGIESLKIKHNNILGYYVEITKTHLSKMKHDTFFIHRQSMINATRFITLELNEMAQDLSQSDARALALELEIFEKLVAEVINNAALLSTLIDGLSELDVATALAKLATEQRFCRPSFTKQSLLEIKDGRHLVVEQSVNDDFISNDCHLHESDHLWLLTGPNMAGKSTFLRQNALIVILAQMGSFVPATVCHMGLVDKLFSRVGAADDLAHGRSTFMVEMVETAAILNRATPQSLVILDEIGRGTATFDGLSIAWATLEHIHNVNGCRCIFATHYHELTALCKVLSSLSTHHLIVKEWEKDIVFMYKIVAGAAKHSYGVQVARLAGLPTTVTERASNILTAIESNRDSLPITALSADLPLFQQLGDTSLATPDTSSPTTPPSVVNQLDLHDDATNADHIHADLLKIIAANDPDQLSPLQALECLYKLRSLI